VKLSDKAYCRVRAGSYRIIHEIQDRPARGHRGTRGARFTGNGRLESVIDPFVPLALGGADKPANTPW
jgi:hypothetical protein